MVRLRRKTRGLIESLLDEALREEAEILPAIEWVREEIPIPSVRDFALGYTVGALKTLGEAIHALPPTIDLKDFSWRTRTEKERKFDAIINTILRRRLPEILEKINRELGR